MQPLTLKDFHFDVPAELVAQHPLPNRDASRLIVRAQNGEIRHTQFGDLNRVLPARCLLILNDSRVLPSRLLGQTAHGGKVELFLLRPREGHDPNTATWWAIGRPMRKFRVGTELFFEDGVVATIVERSHDSELDPVLVQFNREGSELLGYLAARGLMPLPPYIVRDEAEETDRSRYQTVYAEHVGSVAAPTAGLHFTPNVLEALKTAGHQTASVTLHVGGGTFLPVKAETISEHRMHKEFYQVPSATLAAIMRAKAEGTPVVAVGTTAFRAVESFFAARNAADQWHDTSLYIYPRHSEDRYQPHVFNAIITNFHQPESTLFMLICALIGWHNAHALYAEAIAQRYRLFSYGDASLLWI